METKQLDQALSLYLRLTTFPLAIKMLKSPQEIPAKARIPKRDLNAEITLCQAIAMGRRYGWTVAMSKDDHACPYGALTLGQLPAKPYYLDGTYWEEGSMPGNSKAAIERAQSMKRLDYGKYSHILLAPLDHAEFEPELIVIYGNSAQVWRLVQADLYGKKGAIASSSSGGRDCADIITTPLLSKRCRFVLPGAGDRAWGLAQDDEMVFSIPINRAEAVIKGLEATHNMGWRYPTPFSLRSTPQLPPYLRKLMQTLRQAD